MLTMSTSGTNNVVLLYFLVSKRILGEFFVFGTWAILSTNCPLGFIIIFSLCYLVWAS